MYFHGGQGSGNYFASTRDIDLHNEEQQQYWHENFDSIPEG